MLPQANEVLETPTNCVSFVRPNNIDHSRRISFSLGGVAFSDTSEGLLEYTWMGAIDSSGDIWVARVDQDPSTRVTILTGVNATHVSISFDQNMNLMVAYESNDNSYLYWYNTVTTSHETIEVLNAYSPHIELDDKRPASTGISDGIFAYMKNNPDGETASLYMRQQRDRYTVEYLLKDDIKLGKLLQRVGMTNDMRLAFMVCEDDPKFLV